MKKHLFLCIAMLFVAVCANTFPASGQDEITSFTTTPIIPTAKDGQAQWKYTTTSPSSTWKSKNFDDSSWSTGNSSFSNSPTYNTTAWRTSDIWLRKEFTLEGYSAHVVDSLILSVCHDEDCEIYINNVLAAECGGYVTEYKNVAITDAARNSIAVGEKNVIAVHCYNGGGAQMVDVGLYRHTVSTTKTMMTTADVEPTAWKYVTEAPDSLTWTAPSFDDSAWSEGKAGFGKTRSTHPINTQWTTNDLWLRKNVSFAGMKRSDLNTIALKVIRDGVCQIYFNGVLAASLEKNGIKTENVTISKEALDAISFDGETTIAVHCYRTNSLKYFDAALTCQMSGQLKKIEWQMKEGPMKSAFTDDIDVNNVLGEYPRPQMERKQWQSLNGIWDFQPLFANRSGKPEDAYSMEILVPFPVESAISGIMKDYSRFAYRRFFTVPEEWAGKNLLLHFEAVDHECEVFVNGSSVGTHKGGYDPFKFDVTKYLTGEGEQELVVKVYDPTDLGGQPRGKQTLSPGGIMYTSTSGIWQSVWMEPVEDIHIDKYTVVPNVDEGNVAVNVTVKGDSDAQVLLEVKDGDAVVSSVTAVQGKKTVVPVPDAKLWSPDSPFLYDLNISVICDGDTLDRVKGYFGMRKISLAKDGGFTRMFLNNEPVFHIGPLDQGFWPDGIYTAPTDAALLYDIQATKQMGFNMIRKHIKIEPRRWYYHCDRLGMLVWQDMPSGNSYGGVGLDQTQFKKEMTAMIQNLYNSPSIIMWIIFNESQGRHDVETLVRYVKSLDSSRLVNQDSQYGVHSTYVGDVWDIHHYPNPACVVCPNKSLVNVCGEYGGLKYKENGHTWGTGDWGYATMNSRKELMDTYEQYVSELIKYRDCFGLGGAVYTQITDVEIEINGLITYDRIVQKVDFERMAQINNRLTQGTLKKDTIIAIATEGGEMWKMTTTAPAEGWNTTSFDDSKWSTKKSGFGTVGTPNSKIGTTWNTSDIWIRKTFRLDGANRALADSLVMLINHDEDCEIYINGRLMASFEGHDNNYSVVDFTAAVKNELVYDADNLIAIHCHQTTGGQYIDAGIYLLSQDGLTTSISQVVADGTPEVNVDTVAKKVTVSGNGFGENTRMEVISSAGSVLSSAVIGNAPADLSSLPAGMYMLRFTDGAKRYTCKVLL